MAIFKNEFPILEYDTCQDAVILPTHENLPLMLPEKCVFAFLSDHVDTYANEHGAQIISKFVTVTKEYPIYTMSYHGEEICFCAAPLGSSASVQLLDWLIGYGAGKIIATGCCGTLANLPENAFLIPTKALRDEGASYHYLAPSRYVELDKNVIASMKKTLNSLELPFSECVTWTTDGFYRETREMVEYRKSEGCTVVEMECSALAACSIFRNVPFGQLLFTADSLANTERYDERGWGKDGFEKAMGICMEIVRRI